MSVLEEILAAWRELAEADVRREWNETREDTEPPRPTAAALRRAEVRALAGFARIDTFERQWRQRFETER